jgi:hypothetical protein
MGEGELFPALRQTHDCLLLKNHPDFLARTTAVPSSGRTAEGQHVGDFPEFLLS